MTASADWKLRYVLSCMIVLAVALMGAPRALAEGANCCNRAAGEWTGYMPVEACLQQPGHVPDLDPYIEEAKSCKPDGPGGGGGGAAVINIPNGGFEDWEGAKPVGYGTFSTPPRAPIQVETVTRSTDAHTGQYSALIKNERIPIPGMPSGITIPNLPGMPKLPGMPDIVAPLMPGGLVSCKEDCPLSSGRKGNVESMAFPIDDAAENFCGYYKATLLGGDQVFLSLAVRSGATIVGGTNAGPSGAAYITESASEWTAFKIPIVRFPGSEAAKIDSGILEATILPGGQISEIATQAWSAQVNEGSEVKVDTLHFCGPQLDMTVFMPTIAGGFPLPETKEASPGAEGFANLDNDDKDGAFDFEDGDGVTDGDNEMFQVLLQLPGLDELPEGSKDTVIFRQLGGEGKVKVWTTEDKKPGTEFRKFGVPLDVPGDFRDSGAGLEKLLWIEPLKTTGRAEAVFEFSYETAAGRKEEDRVAITVLAIDKVSWRGKGNSEKDDDNLEADENYKNAEPGRAVRVFPGQRPAGGKPDGKRRDTVEAVVTLSEATAWPLPVYLRAFDADDPTADDNAVDREDKPDDNRGAKPGKTGQFTDSKRDAVTVHFKAGETEKIAEFKITMQPGDNFQIAAYGDEKTLAALEHDDKKLFEAGGAKALGHIVDPDVLKPRKDAEAAAVREERNRTSPVLTVWRFFYPEVDKMGPVKDNRVSGAIVSIADAAHDAGGRAVQGSTVTIDRDLASILATKIGNVGIVDSFYQGVLDVPGVRTYNVIGNTAKGRGFDEIKVWPPVVPEAADKGFTLKDDDFKLGFDDGGEFKFPPTGGLEKALKPAYIVPVFDKLTNATPIAPYKRNLESDDQADIQALYAFDNDSIHDIEDFWVVYILGGHQGTTKEDADGEGEVLNGIADALETAPGQGKGAVIFEEGVKERLSGEERANTARAAAGEKPKSLDGLSWEESVAHEVGHLFGAKHGDGGLIDQEGSDFSPDSLGRMRDVEHP